ncbi:MAG TPA: cell division protein ZapA [Blastocatellia bacterium]|nr:cell division protein ZapA [Blastocatellia bacterium]
MDTQSQTVNVKIYNQTYSIRASDGNAERTQQLAALVDQRMREIAKGALTGDSLRVAILAALHIADELDKTLSKYEELNRVLAARSAECAEALDQILKTSK